MIAAAHLPVITEQAYGRIQFPFVQQFAFVCRRPSHDHFQHPAIPRRLPYVIQTSL
jgi:hypothetical protein